MSPTRAFVVLNSGAIVLDINNTLPDLAFGGQQYRIRVRAVAISREEMDWLKQGRTSTFGHAYSGTIDVALFGSCLPVGTAVYGMAPIGSRGAAADYVNACEKDLAVKPKNLTYEQAATIPLAAFVAWPAFSLGNLDHHPDLLIYGAETAVGEMVQQMVRVVNKQRGWAVYPTSAKPILLGVKGTFETIESLPKCEIVIDAMSHGPKLASWAHTKESGTLITTAPYSSTSRGAWPNINVRELQVEHLSKKMPAMFGESVSGEPVLKALKADVIDFDDPDVPARVQNLKYEKQLVLRLGLPDSEDNVVELTVVDLTGEGNGENNAIALTGEGNGANNAIALTRGGNGEHNVVHPTNQGVREDNAIAPTDEGNGEQNVIHPTGKDTVDLTDEGHEGDNPIELSSDSEGEGEGS